MKKQPATGKKAAAKVEKSASREAQVSKPSKGDRDFMNRPSPSARRDRKKVMKKDNVNLRDESEFTPKVDNSDLPRPKPPSDRYGTRSAYKGDK